MTGRGSTAIPSDRSRIQSLSNRPNHTTLTVKETLTPNEFDTLSGKEDGTMTEK